MEVKHAQYCTQKSSQASEGGGGEQNMVRTERREE